jgi:hypothetical protein
MSKIRMALIASEISLTTSSPSRSQDWPFFMRYNGRHHRAHEQGHLKWAEGCIEPEQHDRQSQQADHKDQGNQRINERWLADLHFLFARSGCHVKPYTSPDQVRFARKFIAVHPALADASTQIIISVTSSTLHN